MLQGTGLHTPDEWREQTVRRLVSGPAHARRVSVRSAGGKHLADAAPVGAGTYRPRAAEGTVLHRVVRDNLKTFLGEVADHGDGAGLPRFAERRGFLLTPALSAS